MRKFIEFEINIYKKIEIDEFEERDMIDEEEEMEEWEKQMKGIEDTPVPPKPFIGKFFIDPNEIVAYTECISLQAMYECPDDPVKDQLIIILRNGVEQPVNCTLKEFNKKMKEIE